MGLLLILLSSYDPGFTLERTVKLWSVDTLGRLREIHRRERVKYQDGNLSIEDLTFGERILVRTDRKTVWRFDTLGGTYSELTFDQIRTRQQEVLQEIRAARERVKGALDEGELTALLQSYGWFDADPTVEARSNGKSDKVAGRECRGMNLIVGGDRYLFSEVFVDPSLPSGGYFEAVNRLSTFPDKTLSRFAELGGVPIRGTVRHVFFLERVSMDVEAVSIATGDIPAIDFEPSLAGLKRVPLRGFEKLPTRKIDKPKEFGKNREDELDREQNPLRHDEGKDKK